MKKIRRFGAALVAAVALWWPQPMLAQVKAWEGRLDLPTDQAGPPDVNPRFDLFRGGRFNAFPGISTYARGLHLRELGREAEAQEHFRRVFLLPDKRLLHFLSRRALRGNDPL